MQFSPTINALLQGCALFVAASGLLSTALSIHGLDIGFTPSVIGLIMAAYFFGYVLGTYVCPSVVAMVGHIRAFSVFAAAAAVAALLHALSTNAIVWMALRLLTGMCLAGLYMVVESWLNEQTADSARGRVFAVYQIVSLLGIAIGQWLLLFNPTRADTPFIVCGVLFALALIPTALARVSEPAPVSSVRLDLKYLWSVSPLGVIGACTAAVANSIFFGLGPVFGSAVNMGRPEIAAFMSIVILGGVTLQWPIGHLSDHFDRRNVILLGCIAAASLAASAALAHTGYPVVFFLSAFLYGGFTFSMYPLCVAHSNDHASRGDFMRTASGLLLVYGIGATVGPAIAGTSMSRFGPVAFFAVLAVTYVSMTAFILYRMARRPRRPDEHQDAFVMLNRTSQSALGMMPTAPEAKDEAS